MIEIPHKSSNLGYSREDMPQIPKIHRPAFFEYLKNHKNISTSLDHVDPGDLKPTQKDFIPEKIIKVVQDIKSGKSNLDEAPGVLVSKDNYIVDGHHRAIGSYNGGLKEIPVYRISTNIHKIIKHSHDFIDKNLKEGIDQKQFKPMLDGFTSFVSDHLNLKNAPTIRMIANDSTTSFGGYIPSTKEIVVKTKNRHPMDIFRTIAHEMVHHKQDLDGKIKDPVKEGETGSDTENEANSVAGIIMRNYGKENPDMFDAENLTEATKQPTAKFKAVIMAGGPGSGKDFVAHQTLHGHGMKEINSDHAFEMLLGKEGLSKTMPASQLDKRNQVRSKAKNITKIRERHHLDSRNGVIINTTGHEPEKIQGMKSKLESMGYDTKMVFVHTADEVSRQRNVERGKAGGREVPEDVRSSYWKKAQDAIPRYKDMFGNNFHHVDNSLDLRSSPKEVKDAKMAEFHNIFKHVRKFVSSSPSNPVAQEWMKNNPTKFGTVSAKFPKKVKPKKKPLFVPLDNKVKIRTKKVVVKPDHMDQARSLGLSYFGYGRFGRKIKGRNVVSHSIKNGVLTKINESIDEKFNYNFSNNTPSNREWGKTSLTKIYKNATPGQGKKKEMPKKLAKESNFPTGILDSPSGRSSLPSGGGVGPEYGISNGPSVSFPYAVYGIAESILAWAQKPETQTRFIKKYGNLAELKLNETVAHMISTIDSKKVVSLGPKYFEKIKEAIDYDMTGSVPATNRYKDDPIEENSYEKTKPIKKTRIFGNRVVK